TVFASLSEFSQYQYPFYEQKGLLRVGDPIENKSTLVERMAIVGVDVSYIDSEIPQYDENLELAVKEFQRIHGLNQDGVIGPNTIRWINF
ncbi:peptidoglycan-binding protein, partial [Escherichia coli]|nr:peptidoglycan-binding protein [Escherichia coli]